MSRAGPGPEDKSHSHPHQLGPGHLTAEADVDTLLSSPACVTVASPASGTDPWQPLHIQALSATNTPSGGAGNFEDSASLYKSREVSQTTLCFPGATLSHASEMGTPGPGQMAPPGSPASPSPPPSALWGTVPARPLQDAPTWVPKPQWSPLLRSPPGFLGWHLPSPNLGSQGVVLVCANSLPVLGEGFTLGRPRTRAGLRQEEQCPQAPQSAPGRRALREGEAICKCKAFIMRAISKQASPFAG